MIVAEFSISLGGGTLLTPNTRRRMHWGEQARISKAQRAVARLLAWNTLYEARMQLRKHGLPPQSSRDIHLSLVRGKGQRLIDEDAIPTGCKPYLDGIVDAGLLVDDSPKWCHPTYEQIRGPRAELRVRITQPSEKP